MSQEVTEQYWAYSANNCVHDQHPAPSTAAVTLPTLTPAPDNAVTVNFYDPMVGKRGGAIGRVDGGEFRGIERQRPWWYSSKPPNCPPTSILQYIDQLPKQ